MRIFIIIVGLLALTNIINVIDSKAVVQRILEKRHTTEPPKCDDANNEEEEDVIFVDSNDEPLEEGETLDFHQTEELEESNRDAICQLVNGPISHSRLLQITTRMSELLRRPDERPDRPSRTPEDIDRAARNLINALSNEEPQESSESSALVPPSKRRRLAQEEEFCSAPTGTNKRRWKSRDSLEKAVQMYDQGVPEAVVHKRYKQFYRQHLDYYRQCLSRSASAMSKSTMTEVNAAVIRKFRDARAKGLPVHDDQLQQWGLDLCREMDGPRNFRASHWWAQKLKRENMISGRRITKLVSRADLAREDLRNERIEKFRQTFRGINYFFPRRLILNTDQSGFNYEMSDKRTLDAVGTRDVIGVIESASKTTHSYTIQPIVTRDGRLVGKMLIVFQEDHGTFPRTLETQIIDQARQYGNVYVTASQSGKLTNALIEEWELKVLVPTVNALKLPHDGETEVGTDSSSGGSQASTIIVHIEDEEASEDHYQPDDDDFGYVQQNFNEHVGKCWLYPWENSCAHGILERANNAYLGKPDALLIRDSLSSQSNQRAGMRLREHGIKNMIIPPKTTDYLQPLDISLFRQWKAFVKRLTRQARLDDMIGAITSRSGIINMQSLVYNQLSGPLYHDLRRYGWRHLDSEFSELEYTRPRPLLSISDQFNQNSAVICEVQGCHHSSLLRCSHCGKHLCLKHFLDRACFHEDSPVPGTSGVTSPPQVRDGGDNDDSD